MARSTDVWSRHYLNRTEDHIFASISKIKTNYIKVMPLQ